MMKYLFYLKFKIFILIIYKINKYVKSVFTLDFLRSLETRLVQILILNIYFAYNKYKAFKFLNFS